MITIVVVFLFTGHVAAQSQSVFMQCLFTNTNGCKMIRSPTYLVVAPGKIRPMQVINVFVSALHMEYDIINIRVSVVKDIVEYASEVARFDKPGSKMLQLMLPSNAMPGNYKMRTEGFLTTEDSGNIFSNETEILFDKKQASVFIQISQPFYMQGQTVKFRVIPLKPNLMPKHGSMTIFIMDPSGFPVRRWQGQQTNVGGFVEKSFNLSSQPKFGDWSILVKAHGYDYMNNFTVYENYQERFEVNVTVPAFTLSHAHGIEGVIFANHTSGKAVTGNATINMTVVRRGEIYNESESFRHVVLSKTITSFHGGRIDFNYSRDEILRLTDEVTMAGMEFFFNVSVFDWELMMTRTAYGSTYCHESRFILKWVGGGYTTFKPDSVFSATVAIMHADGTPVTRPMHIHMTPTETGTQSVNHVTQKRQLVDGFATFSIYAKDTTNVIKFTAHHELEQYDSQIIGHSQEATLRAYRYHSPGANYVTVKTSTRNPKVNEYMIFHIRTSVYVPKVYYQIVSQGNILLGDEILMISRQKTFSIALSRDMVPSARIVVYYVRQPEEVVVDSLNFFVNGTRLNPVQVSFNRGKDYKHHTVELNIRSDPGSYIAIGGIQHDLYKRGLHDGLSENMVIDELLTYDAPAKGPYLHKWRISETESRYNFFTAAGYGIDAASTFKAAGLAVMTDAALYELPNSHKCREDNRIPCYNGLDCYLASSKCDGSADCPDWSDEIGCEVEERNLNTRHPMDRIKRLTLFFHSSDWIWREQWIKPDGRVDLSVDVPKPPLVWVVNAFSLSADKGFGIIEKPVRFDATRYMYIWVEAPEYVVRGEQIGIRVTVFNYWYGDDFMEVTVKLHASDNYKFINVEEFGFVNSFAPRTSSGEHMTLLYLEAGESHDIYMPVLPIKWVDGKVSITISAISFLTTDTVTKTLQLRYNGVENLWHSPLLIDLITKGFLDIPEINIPIRDTPVIPEQRELAYIPESPEVTVLLSGDVMTPGLFSEYLTTKNLLNLPYGSCEQSMFNMAYNVYTLLFKKESKQLDLTQLQSSMKYLNRGLQRVLSYMNVDGSFSMFRDDNRPSLWATTFVARILSEAHIGEWTHYLFIPIDLVDKIAQWICSQQKPDGSFEADGGVYDRKFASILKQSTTAPYNDAVTLTSYVLIALNKISHVSIDTSALMKITAKKAQNYLTGVFDSIDDNEIFQIAIATYALSLTNDQSNRAYRRLMDLSHLKKMIYWGDGEVPEIQSDIINTVKVMEPRLRHESDGYAVQATSYALMTMIRLEQNKPKKRIAIMQWLQTMRSSVGGFASTQDTIVAMEALMEFTRIDPNRKYFDITFEITATSQWQAWHRMTATNYTNTYMHKIPNAWGYIQMTAKGTGRALLQVKSVSRHIYPWQLLQPRKAAFNVSLQKVIWSGRNYSYADITVCTRWFYTQKSIRSGMAVLHVDIPTGFKVINGKLRDYAASGKVPNLKFAEMYSQRLAFYFEYLDESETCVTFNAERWWPIANGTEYHLLSVFEYYEPGLFNQSMYTTVNLYNLNLCYACASYQCPFCPQFNSATVTRIKFHVLQILCLIFFYLNTKV